MINYSTLKKDAIGVIAPIGLIGPLGSGKERNFSELVLSTNELLKTPIQFDLSAAHPSDPAQTVGAAFEKIYAHADEYGATLAVFTGLKFYRPEVIADLSQALSANTNPNVVCVLGFPDARCIPERLASLPMQFIQYESTPIPPVMQVEEHEESDLHEYGYNAEFLAKYPSHLEQPIADGMLDSLSRLMTALEGVDGGILGQEASDRGMDAWMIKHLSAFARTYKNSENAQAAEISKSYIAQMLAFQHSPTFSEYRLPKQKHQLDSHELDV